MKFTLALPTNRTHSYEVTTEWHKTRNGFCHVAKTYSADGTEIVHRVGYCNRTWETYPYQTAVHGLISKVVAHEFGCPSERSFRSAKKWENERTIAYMAMNEIDRSRCY